MRTETRTRILLLIVFTAAVTSLVGLENKGIECWDEGVYYSEARFLVQACEMAGQYARHRLVPAERWNGQEARSGVTGLAPRMGRPVNALLNAGALALLGDQPWVPALVATAAGLGCIYVVFIIMQRLYDSQAGLLAAGLLALSPYFLPYRRIGLPEAAGALLSCLTLLALLRSARPGERRSRLHSWGLGILCGLSFGINTRTLALLPAVVLWRAWDARGPAEEGGGEQWWAHALRVVGGFALMPALYQLPYAALQLAGRPSHMESYLDQLRRFALDQQALAGVGPLAAYRSVGYFLAYYEGPTLVLLLVGLTWCLSQWRQSSREAVSAGPPHLLLPSLLVLPVLQAGMLVPYARYQSWLLPILAMISALGLREVMRWSGLAGRGAQKILVLMMVVTLCWHSCCRGLPIVQSRSRQAEALQWARSRGAAAIVDSNMSAALAYSPLYRLERLSQLPLGAKAAAAAIRSAQAHGPVMVIVETQQYMREAVVMGPSEYEQTAAAAIGRDLSPLWQRRGHLRGLFPFLCFEHNRLPWETLETLARYGGPAETISIYDGEAVVRSLSAAGRHH